MEVKKGMGNEKEIPAAPDPSAKREWHAPELHKSSIQKTTNAGSGFNTEGTNTAAS